MDQHTVRINDKNYNTLMKLRDIGEFKSVNHVIESLLPEGIISTWDSEVEKPAFTLLSQSEEETNVSWEMLRTASEKTTWTSTDEFETATVMFKDDTGALVRFTYGDDYFLNYFHFLK